MISSDKYKIYSLGENALTVDFGNQISLELNEKVISFAENLAEKRVGGILEIVPAYSSVTIFYDIHLIRKSFPEISTAFEAVKMIVDEVDDRRLSGQIEPARTFKIPVDFSQSFALDLAEIAKSQNLTIESFIEIFLARTYRVYMLGFLPGFAYLGEVDERIAVPRKSSPRIAVPAGSVGIAGRQTGIYPFDSPGGWQIIGRTELKLFDANADGPCLLRAGDAIKFYCEQ